MISPKIPVISKLSRPCCRNYFKNTSITSMCPRPMPYKYKVTLMDCACDMGKALAFMLKQNSIIKELRLYDDKKDVIGIGMDLSDIDTSTRISAYAGEENLTEALTGTDLVINCGGYSSNPFESYEDLFEKNAEDIRRTAMYLTEFNRRAIFCIAKPPVESLVPMVYQEYCKAGVKVPEVKIVGAANYSSMVINTWISKFMKADAFRVTCPIIGGASSETVVGVVSGSNPGKKLTNPRVLNAIQEGMAYEEERLLSITIKEDGGCAAFAPAVSTYRLINRILKGLRGDEDTYDCAFVKQEGHLKKFLPFMTSIVKFGPHGVYNTHMPDMVGSELYRLKAVYPVLKAYIHLGEQYVHGLPLPSAECNNSPCLISRVKTSQDEPKQNPSEYTKCDPQRATKNEGDSYTTEHFSC